MTGCPPIRCASCRSSNAKNRELEETIEILGGNGFFVRRATPNADLCVHRRAWLGSGSLRSAACSLSTAARSPENLLRLAEQTPSARTLWDTVITEVLAGYYEPDQAGRRAPESLYGATKNVGPPATPRHHGGPLHRGTPDAGKWVAGVTRHRKVRTTIADPAAARPIWSGGSSGARTNMPSSRTSPVRCLRGVRLHRVLPSMPTPGGSWVGPARPGRVIRFVRQAIRHAAQLRCNEGNHCWATLFTTRTRGRSIRRCGSGKPCLCPVWCPPSAASATHSITLWRKRPSACTKPKLCVQTHRFGADPGSAGRRRTTHRRLGPLVQHRPPHAPPGPHPTHRIREPTTLRTQPNQRLHP